MVRLQISVFVKNWIASTRNNDFEIVILFHLNPDEVTVRRFDHSFEHCIGAVYSSTAAVALDGCCRSCASVNSATSFYVDEVMGTFVESELTSKFLQKNVGFFFSCFFDVGC